MTSNEIDTSDTRRLNAVRAWAQWHLGSPEWADDLIDAWNHPVLAMERLRASGYTDD